MSTPKKKQPIQATLPRVAPAKKPARKAKPAKKPAQEAPPIMLCKGVIKPKPDAGPLPKGSPISIRRDPAARPIPPPPPKKFEAHGEIYWQDSQPQASPPMIRLRLPSERVTKKDADKQGNVFVVVAWKDPDETVIIRKAWRSPFEKGDLAWFSLPDGILPREPSQEEKWRAEFEEKMGIDFNFERRSDGIYYYTPTFNAWLGFLAAKKGGAE
jgi:hypothetical protein